MKKILSQMIYFVLNRIDDALSCFTNGFNY